MRKNTKNIEIKEVTTVPGTQIGMLVMKDGTRYFKQRSICRVNQMYPGEYRKIVGIISWDSVRNNLDRLCKYARVWYNRGAYIHEDDLRTYILERQGIIENKQALRQGKGTPYWTVEAAAAIKAIFGFKVSTNGRHEMQLPKELTAPFENNAKLRSLYILEKKAESARKSYAKAQRVLANSWPDYVHATEDIVAWKLQHQD